MRAYQLPKGGAGIESLALVERPAPKSLLQGISVGSMQTFETMNAAIAANKIKPVIDRVFGFDEVQAAYQHMAAGAHFGKIVIRVA